MTDYKVVSEVRRSGQWIDIPDDAIDVTIEPLSTARAARVTYLRPVREVPIGGSRPDRDYVH